MKQLLTAILMTLISQSAFATSYCYDYAQFALYDLEEMVVDCSKQYQDETGKKFTGVNGEDVKVIRKMHRKLMSWNPIGYSRRNLKQLTKVQMYIQKLRYETKLECTKEITKFFNEKTIPEVNEAIRYCGI